MVKREEFKALFDPRSIAVVGVSRSPEKLGHRILRNLIDFGFVGKVYPVNPKATEILGLVTYPNVQVIPDTVDLAIILVPAQYVLETIRNCGKKQVKFVIIESAGFAETGNEGARLQAEIVNVAKNTGMRVVGPNCIGVMNTDNHLCGGFGLLDKPERGTLALITQGGFFATAVVDWVSSSVSFSKVVSIGNKCDVDETELLEYLYEDPQTEVISIYIEGIRDLEKFQQVARAVSRKKPIVVIKSGKTEEGKNAVKRHTGTDVGIDSIYNHVFEEAGVVRAQTLEELLDFSKIFIFLQIPSGNRVAIVSTSGSLAARAADELAPNGLRLARLKEKSLNLMREIWPAYINPGNPIDISLTFDFERGLDIAFRDENVDCVIAAIPGSLLLKKVKANIDSILLENHKKYPTKPLVVCHIGREEIWRQLMPLNKMGVPVYPSPERAVRALGALYRYKCLQEKNKACEARKQTLA